ncbi:MAG: chalcone isomerase family protein [Candidatus Rokubacteria bacterium]|nr:chalcone isomerase family protein [Candidatus Rokubacteria bacterium]
MNMTRFVVTAAAAWALGAHIPAPSTAGELAGVTLPDQVTVEGRTLVLNGMGLRQATIFRVNVYVGGLYLEARSSDASQIIASEGTKRLVLHFVRDVGRENLVEAWDEGFAKSAGPGLTALRARVATLDAWMVDMKRGDTLSFTQLPGRGIVVEVKGQSKGTLVGADFARALWGIWLGDSPPNPGLKKGLLGG